MKPGSTASHGAAPAFVATPPPTLPLAFFVPALACLVAAAAFLPFLAPRLAGGFWDPGLLALVHLVTAGFLLGTFLGATVQLLPVLTGEAWRGARVPRLAAVIHAVGAIALVVQMALFRTAGIAAAGTIVFLAGLLVAIRAAPAVFRARLDAPILGLGLSFAGLLFAVGFGVFAAAARVLSLPGDPVARLGAHLHLGLVATLGVAIFGVEARLLPMFLVAEPPGDSRQRASLLLTFGGGTLVAASLAAGWPVWPGALLAAGGLGAQIVCVAGVLRSRRRREIETPFRYVVSAYADLTAASVVGLFLAFGGADGLLRVRLVTLYGALLLVGFTLQTVVGVLSKILPFLIWNAVYARRVGLGPVPLLRDMSSERLQAVGFVLFRVATIAFYVAILRGQPGELQAAAALLAASFVPLAVHAVRVLLHLRPPPAPRTGEDAFAPAR